MVCRDIFPNHGPTVICAPHIPDVLGDISAQHGPWLVEISIHTMGPWSEQEKKLLLTTPHVLQRGLHGTALDGGAGFLLGSKKS